MCIRDRSQSRHGNASPLHPGCPSPPLLSVWMNVSSLSPWLLDFYTVRFSVSSGWFLFLNCCCPSFGCARRHSVSTYTSILARSLTIVFFQHFDYVFSLLAFMVSDKKLTFQYLIKIVSDHLYVIFLLLFSSFSVFDFYQLTMTCLCMHCIAFILFGIC